MIIWVIYRVVYPPLGSEIERFRIRNEQTDEQKKFVAGISTEKSEAQK